MGVLDSQIARYFRFDAYLDSQIARYFRFDAYGYLTLTLQSPAKKNTNIIYATCSRQLTVEVLDSQIARYFRFDAYDN